MLEYNRAGNLNTYVQGSVWIWKKNTESDKSKTEHTNGVQSDGRPVLIISNDTFNQRSPSVNCFTITSVLKNTPVHVDVILDVPSHIQCEQIHTVPKNELVAYKGMIPALTLSIVKEKVKIQFDMNTDKSLVILTDIMRRIDELNERAVGGFGLSDFASEMSSTLVNIHNCYVSIKTELDRMQGKQHSKQAIGDEKADGAVIQGSADAPITKLDKKSNHRNYSDDDIVFLLDKTKPISVIMEKFGFKTKTALYSARTYYKKKSTEQTKGKDSKQGAKKTHRRYKEDDVLFILDKGNSIDAIVERFGFKGKQEASKMRSYFRKKQAVQEADS